MATSISYVLKHKSKFFDTLLNDLQTVSKEYQKRLKKVGILRVKGCPYINHKISLRFEPYHDHFFDFSQSFYDASSYGGIFKKVIFIDGFNLN